MKKHHHKIDVRVRERKISLPGNEFMLRDHTPYDIVIDFDEEWPSGEKTALMHIRLGDDADWTKTVPVIDDKFTIEAPTFQPDDGRMYLKLLCGELETDEAIIRILPNLKCPNCGGIIVPDIGYFRPAAGKPYHTGRR